MSSDGKTYYRCSECGWIGARTFTKRNTCPDCRKDEMSQVQIKMVPDLHRKAWVGYFADMDGHQISPLKAGMSEEEVLRRLESMDGY